METDLIVMWIIIACVIVLFVLWLLRLRRINDVLQQKFNTLQEEWTTLHDKYKGIEDRDAEIGKREAIVEALSQKQAALESDQAKKVAELNDEYTKYRALYDKLRSELSLVEENLEIQSFGVYKPHFDFATSEEYKAKLELNYEEQKSHINAARATRCEKEWSVGNSRREGERMVKQYMKLILRAFNGECDACVSKVRWNNVTIMEKRIEKAYESLNKLGESLSISITPLYLAVKLEELQLTHEYQEKLYKEKEEQRLIQEQMREEEKVQREAELARKEAEDEEKRYQKALEKVRVELEKAKGEELDELSEKIKGLEQQLHQAQEEKERAISRAQLTKSGHVYIISNIGSFGENVFKIGMTRRLEPLDRIRELGDASVPFSFDVHAMAYSENAPELERKLHDFFEWKRVNLINERKEFFNVTIKELEKFARTNNLPITITQLAEAKEYRETLALKKQRESKQEAIPEPSPFPNTLIGVS